MNDQLRAPNGLRQSLEQLPGSLIRHVAEPNMGKEGLLKLWFGEPDVPTPQFIKDAATAALDDNQVFYAKNRGVPVLRDTIAEYASNLHGREIGIDRMSLPSRRIRPSWGSYRRHSRRITVVLPEPVGPTRATCSPGAIRKERLRRIGSSGR